MKDTIAPRHLEALQARFALRIAAGLSELSESVPTPDIDERLRIARTQALERSAMVRRAGATRMLREPVFGRVLAGSAGPGHRSPERAPWWLRLAAVAPLAILIAGLALIQHWQQRAQIEAAAEIDAALLTDDLPPSAYADPGFVQFLKQSGRGE